MKILHLLFCLLFFGLFTISCIDNSAAEVEKLKLQIELEKVKAEAAAKAAVEKEIQESASSDETPKSTVVDNQSPQTGAAPNAKSIERKVIRSSTLRIVLDEIDDIAFAGFPTRSNIQNNNYPISISAQYSKGGYNNGSRTGYVESDIPIGTSYFCIGAYNWVWTGFGKGKYQYNIRAELNGDMILNKSTGGRINDNSEGMKYFEVMQLTKDSDGQISVNPNVPSDIRSSLKSGYSRMMSMRNPG